MPNVPVLNEMVQLERTRFGRPSPRHGLQLLYWFATECASFENGDLVSQYDPERGEFGFHLYENRYDQNGIQLLPDVDYPYYILGNLNSDGAEQLPYYVRELYTGLQDDSNMDRIIVSLDDDYFDKVYITAHNSVSKYDINSTYRITSSLLDIISRRTLDGFLFEMGYSTRRPNSTPPRPNVSPSINQECQIKIEPSPKQRERQPEPEPSFWDNFCTIL